MLQDRFITNLDQNCKTFCCDKKDNFFFFFLLLLGQLCLIEPEIFGSDLQTFEAHGMNVFLQPERLGLS